MTTGHRCCKAYQGSENREESNFNLFSIFHRMCTAGAEKVSVDLELALGVDVSGSVDEEEAMLQRNGYINAFRHPAILEAIQRGPKGRIAVGYYEWAGFGHMKIIVPWTLIKTKNPP